MKTPSRSSQLAGILCLLLPVAAWGSSAAAAAPVDVAPFGMALPEGNGVYWDDPREIHQVVVHFKGAAPAPERVRLEYWGSHWPEEHLPKDKEIGSGASGWMELGNWYIHGWRAADVEAKTEGDQITFSFRPVNAREFSKVKNYPATFRYTLKVRIVAETNGLAGETPASLTLPEIRRVEAFTDSVWEERRVRLVWQKPVPAKAAFEAFNGSVKEVEKTSAQSRRLVLQVAANPDPNTFDRTLITVQAGREPFTFAADDLVEGPLVLPAFGVAVLNGADERDYAAVVAEQKRSGAKTVYERVAEMPEQTWRSAWEGMPPKKAFIIYLPLNLDGGRERFRLNPDGSIQFRSNDQYLTRRPGQDTPRLALEKANRHLRFNLPGSPVARSLEEDSLPICRTSWDEEGVRIEQTAFVTALLGTQADGGAPPSDTFAVFMARFTMTNPTNVPLTAKFRLKYDDSPEPLRVDTAGWLWAKDKLRGQVLADSVPTLEGETSRWISTLAPGESKTVLVKIPYVVLTEASEREALNRLDFEKERCTVGNFWRNRLAQSTRLITPEPVLNQFYRAHAGHLLMNCEREPNSERRFARVGSFNYGAYGNESCMMVVELDRRGYQKEAQDCLDAWLHYQGTVGLPGDFASKDGVLYGAGGYEAGGYNQHHGWILWTLAEHYRFTRDEGWLRQAAPGIVKGADWIIRETKRTAQRTDLARGLLPAGSLEDIGDWWTWLSTSCYTWRGLDAAAWALAQIKHPDARRVRREADQYHANLIANFRAAAQRSPVVRLRDGTAVPHIPSYVQRRGRSFGWICETLEGGMHLLSTGAIAPHSPEADWILNDYEDNLFLSSRYGYTVSDFDKYWFGRGGMAMQACLLLDVEPYLYRDDVKHALRAAFNALAVSHFPDVHMNTEHALPEMGDWRGDHYKTSDEANACGWLRYLFVREQGEELWLGQAVPRDWLKPGENCGVERAVTYFGTASVIYTSKTDEITAQVDGPRRNAPRSIRLRFREPKERPLASVTVNGKRWKDFKDDWVRLPGGIGAATVVAGFTP